MWSVFNNNTEIEVALFAVTGTSSLLSIALTSYLVFCHLKHWVDPTGQRAIIRIITIVAFYSLVSWLAILIGNYALYFTLVRDCYEAYVLYQFFSLMVHYLQKDGPAALNTRHHGLEQLGLEPEEPGTIIAYIGETSYPFPLCNFTYQPGRRAFLHIKRCILQYVFIKPLTSFIAILLELIGAYHSGSFAMEHGYFWLSFIQNISAFIALYFVILFYELIKEIIKAHSPLLKLLSIKVLVFLLFWQSILFTLLYYYHIIPSFFAWSIERSSGALQNVLICLEMMILSLFNLRAFSYTTYRREPGEHTLSSALTSIQSVLSQNDLIDDTKEVFHPDRLKHAVEKQL